MARRWWSLERRWLSTPTASRPQTAISKRSCARLSLASERRTEFPMATMPAVVHHTLAPKGVELREHPVPEIGHDDVLLAVRGVSVCGSDVHQYHNSHSWRVN